MKDKNIKKQHATQALGEDSLENVSGGFMISSLHLSDAEKECLNKDHSWMENLPPKSSPDYERLRIRHQAWCLRRHGFHAE